MNRVDSAFQNPHSAFKIARPGIEPGLRPSQSRVQSATLTGCKYRVRESNPVPQFRRLRCYPAHPHGMFSIPTWNRTRTWTLGESCAIRYTIEIWGRRLDLHQHQPVYKTGASLFGHVGKARAQGVEPCPSVLEADCSPRSTLVFEGIRRESNPYFLLHRQACVPRTPQTPYFSSSTRIRTWNLSLEARHDVRFTIEPKKRKAWDLNPHDPGGRTV